MTNILYINISITLKEMAAKIDALSDSKETHQRIQTKKETRREKRSQMRAL